MSIFMLSYFISVLTTLFQNSPIKHTIQRLDKLFINVLNSLKTLQFLWHKQEQSLVQYPF
jgi:hypothetical protein